MEYKTANELLELLRSSGMSDTKILDHFTWWLDSDTLYNALKDLCDDNDIDTNE